MNRYVILRDLLALIPDLSLQTRHKSVWSFDAASYGKQIRPIFFQSGYKKPAA